MADYFLDTNHASVMMASPSLMLTWFQRTQNIDSRFGISMTTLAELYFAVYASQFRARNLMRLQKLLGGLRLWEFDRAAAEEFGKIREELKVKGRPIPPLDIQIAAVARVNRLIVLTADRHFSHVDKLSINNWL